MRRSGLSRGSRRVSTDAHDHDPLASVLQPPLNESEDAKAARVASELEAKFVSDAIDSRLAEDGRDQEWRKKALKILLLGQAESGKSTVLKNFQLLNSPTCFEKRRKAWKAVIQLNLIRSVQRLWEGIDIQQAKDKQSSTSVASSNHLHRNTSNKTALSRYSTELQRLKLKLSPLQQIQEPLKQSLALAPFYGFTGKSRQHLETDESEEEFFVRSGSDWEANFGSNPRRGMPASTSGAKANGNEDAASMILYGCLEDMVALWNSQEVKKMLGPQARLKLIHSPGFFLPDADRIATLDYEPTDKDILRARIRTIGASEHIFKASERVHGLLGREDWILWDVGGAKCQRDKWSPYFEQVNAIIFLAPISAFDEYLGEDSTTNRINDSVQIWRHICSNKLLVNAALILFLNKTDLLKAKLTNGVQVSHYVKSYGDRTNDWQTFTKYMRAVFKAELTKTSARRPFLCHETAAINHTATSQIIGDMHDNILREMLTSSGVL